VRFANSAGLLTNRQVREDVVGNKAAGALGACLNWDLLLLQDLHLSTSDTMLHTN
jgi:hypothetical protein